MPLIRYQDKNFHKRSLNIIAVANKIIDEYTAQGYILTLRQLYYQFVARGFLENSLKSYNNLGNVISDGRLAGLIDWEAIEDRTRNLSKLGTWDSPAEILEQDSKVFKYDFWEKQPVYIEVWVEKEALVGVIERSAYKWRCPYFACRGYTSQSEAWNAGQRFIGKAKLVKVIHLGDHDPSGIDMTRDNDERLKMFTTKSELDYEYVDLEIIRVALNMPQVQQYNPPPNPAKITDTRFADYQRKFGDESWELDALDPRVIDELISNEITQYIDFDIWEEDKEREKKAKKRLSELAANWKE